MMEAVFLKFLNMSIAAGWLILAVLMMRLCLRRAPRWITCLLWGMVGVRLAFPFTFESVWSLIPSADTVPAASLTATSPVLHSGIAVVDRVVNTVVAPSLTPVPYESVTPMQILTFAASLVWGAGMIAMLMYAAVSYIRLRRLVREAAWQRDNVWVCDQVYSPFILGIFRPRILLPSTLGDRETDCVLAHERAHLSRRDHWWKPLGFLLLAVHWYNPLVWAAYVLLCRDIEAACDERVIRPMDAQGKQVYSSVLLECSTVRRRMAVCPLAFGESNVKNRIRAILGYRKPALWVTIAALVACVVVAVCFLTDPPGPDLFAGADEPVPPVSDGTDKTPASGDENVNPSFTAVVKEVLDSSVLVEAHPGQPVTGLVTVSTKVVSTHPVPDLKAGMSVRVVYNGEIMETYPAQIRTVFAIYGYDPPTDPSGQSH